MRRGIMLGLGLAGALAAQTTAAAQFATDRGTQPAAPPAQPPAAAPAAAPAPAEPPARPPAQPPVAGHPWYVRPDLGPWMICIKSYSGPESRKLAEALAAEIRQTHNAGSYLFEWGSEERQQEQERRDKVREELQKEQAPFLQVREQMKQKAAAEGIEFIDTPVKVRVPIVRYPEQWAVLVGGFKDMDAARKALDAVRQWPAPKDTRLMDQAFISRPGQPEAAYINPFAAAMTAPNPAIRRGADGQAPAIDPAVVKLNEAEELSLLKARKPWTLMVKRFVVPMHVQGKAEDGTVFDKLFGKDDAARWLEITATNARTLAQALRNKDMKPRPFESFVLHYRTESLVTVGQFDGPEDPALQEAWKILSEMTFKLDYKDGRPAEMKKMFDVVIPMQAPRAQ
ncbi:MAG TPA: hypothetical protein VM533_16890 [Fimbriiglobus sp.]|nr:hypothetical protein [Fimbriiglobus sp.]